jgi:hypothetical protein
MLIDKVYSAVSQIANKNQLGGYISPAEFNKYAEFAQIDAINETVDGKLSGALLDIDELSDVIKTTQIAVASGFATQPSDYFRYRASMGYSVYKGKGRSVVLNLVEENEWAERLASEINIPTTTFPIMRGVGTSFEVAPATLNQIVLTYVKVPLMPWWNYTLSGSTPVFAATSGTTTNPNSGVTAGDSTDLTLSDAFFPTLVFKICRYFGIEIKDADLYQGAITEQKN